MLSASEINMLTRHAASFAGLLVLSSASTLHGQCEQQLQKLVAPDGGAGRQFGYSVAVWGDWMVVGAPLANDPAPHSGAVYLYHRGGNGQWGFDRKLTSGEPADRFAGASVAMTSEQTLFTRFGACVGRWLNSSGQWSDSGCLQTSSGAVYASTIGATENTTWWSDGYTMLLQDRRYGYVQNLGSGYGITLALGADFAACGFPFQPVRNAHGEQVDGAGVFSIGRRIGGYWQFNGPLYQALDPALDAYMGSSVAINDRTCALGAFNATTPPLGDRTGAVYLFDLPPGGYFWTQTAKLAASDPGTGDLFGYQVAFDELGDRLAITAPWKDSSPSTPEVGCVYVFERSGVNEWVQTRQFFANDARESAQLGISLVYSGGYLVVGAPGDSQQGDSAGAVYVFSVDPQRPSIDSGPNTATVRVGQTAFFDISASGSGTMTYQWRRNGSPLSDGGKIAGSRTAHLRIRNCHWSDTASFDCVVANGCDSTTSRSADLVVQCPADFNDDSFLDFFDYDDFIVAFEHDDPRADFNRDDFIDFFDYDDFVQAFELGC